MSRSIVLAIAAVALAACAASNSATLAPGEKLKITKETWADFQQYLSYIGSTHPGAYAVTTDGTGQGGAVCDDIACMGLAREEALKSCKRHNPGHDCIIFAFGDDILLPYEVLP